MGVFSDGSILGSVGGGKVESIVIEEALKCIEKNESKTFVVDSSRLGKSEGNTGYESSLEVFIKVFEEKPKLLLVGGGHVAKKLYELGIYMNFAVSIFEDREDFCSNERFPKAQELIYGDLKESISNYNIDNNCYIVMVSRGHMQDEKALREVVLSDAKYIGMIGSKQKVKNIFNNLLESGIPNDKLDRVFSPIGINIGGNSINEIALGIMAEIVLIKNNGSLNHMKKVISK